VWNGQIWNLPVYTTWACEGYSLPKTLHEMARTAFWYLQIEEKNTHFFHFFGHFFHFYLVIEYLFSWVLLAGSALPFFSNYKCISVWAQVLTTPKNFKTRSYFEIRKHFSAEYGGGNDLSWTTWRQLFISCSSAGWTTPIFLQLNWCKFQQGICSLIQKEREKILPVCANGIPTNAIFKFSRFQWPYYCDQQQG
jgi:hypothetical protein